MATETLSLACSTEVETISCEPVEAKKKCCHKFKKKGKKQCKKCPKLRAITDALLNNPAHTN